MGAGLGLEPLPEVMRGIRRDYGRGRKGPLASLITRFSLIFVRRSGRSQTKTTRSFLWKTSVAGDCRALLKGPIEMAPTGKEPDELRSLRGLIVMVCFEEIEGGETPVHDGVPPSGNRIPPTSREVDARGFSPSGATLA